MKELPSHCVNLKKFRKRKGLTQKQLADILGVSLSCIKSLEAYKANPSYKWLKNFKYNFPDESMDEIFFS